MQRARTDNQKDQRRSALLEAALDEFFERGFTAARMDDIAKRAGVSKGAVYLYFSSKEDLFTSLVDLHAKPNVERIEAISNTARSFREGMRAFVQLAPMLIRDSKIPRLMKILIGDAINFPESVRLYRERVIEKGLAAISGLLKRADSSGEIDAPDPDSTARLIVAPLLLGGVWRIVFEETDPDVAMDLDAFFAEHVRMLERALLVSDPEGETNL